MYVFRCLTYVRAYVVCVLQTWVYQQSILLTCLSVLHSYLLHVPLCAFTPSSFTYLWVLRVFPNMFCVIFLACYYIYYIFSNLKHSLIILGTHLILCSKVKKNFLQQQKYVFSLKNIFTAQDYLLLKFLFLSSWKYSLGLLFRCICKKKIIFQFIDSYFNLWICRNYIIILLVLIYCINLQFLMCQPYHHIVNDIILNENWNV